MNVCRIPRTAGSTARSRSPIECALAALVLVLLTTAVASAKLRWEELPHLPDELGFGGPAAGVHQGALIVAGGANFPEAPPWEGGKKVWHDRIFVLEKDATGQPANEWLEAGTLPQRLAYSASISTADGMLIIGGEASQEPGAAEPVDTVYRLQWNPQTKKVRVDTLPRLPRPASYLAAGKIGATVYVVAAARSAGADRLDQKYFWSLDLSKLATDPDTEWQTLEPYPGSPRHKAIVAVQARGEDKEYLFLISGENPRFNTDGSPDLANFENLTDAYRYDPAAGSWTPIADLPILADERDVPNKEQFENDRWPVVASTGIGIGQSHVLVFSGSTGRYITGPPQQHPPFSKYVLAYHTITDTWTKAGEMPLGVVTTSITQWNNRVVIPSGEIRPGVRTNKVQALTTPGFNADFGALNFGVLFAYLGGVLAVGGLFALRTKSTDDFFRGGQRVPFWVAGLSIFATMLSSITFVALPAKVFATDWLYYAAQVTILPVALIVVYLAIPFFRHIDATSAYEYLEKRFNYLVRMLASAQFVLFQIGRMAIVMYLPALALATITPWSVIQCVLIMGVLSVVYCTLGGVEAVVWTDAIQTLVLMGGLLVAILVIVAQVDGGASTVLQTAYHDGKLRVADLDFSSTSYMTTALWVVVLGQFFQSLYSYTSDQAVVQRYLTTKDQRAARRAMWTTTWMTVFGSVLFFMMGTALYVFYKTFPEQLDVGMRNDAVFPLFIATQLPVGVAGLVVAGIFAAAQSTISTSMNSTATAIVTDFCKPWRVCRTDAGYLMLARVFTALLGIGGTAMACWLARLNETSMMDTYIKVVGLFGGAICGLFMLGILTRRANAVGGLIGSVCGVAAVVLATWAGVHWFLFAMVGTLVTMGVGYAVSMLLPAPAESQLRGLTIYDRLDLQAK